MTGQGRGRGSGSPVLSTGWLPEGLWATLHGLASKPTTVTTAPSGPVDSGQFMDADEAGPGKQETAEDEAGEREMEEEQEEEEEEEEEEEKEDARYEEEEGHEPESRATKQVRRAALGATELRDWTCLGCGNVNWAKRAKCNKCQAENLQS